MLDLWHLAGAQQWHSGMFVLGKNKNISNNIYVYTSVYMCSTLRDSQKTNVCTRNSSTWYHELYVCQEQQWKTPHTVNYNYTEAALLYLTLYLPLHNIAEHCTVCSNATVMNGNSVHIHCSWWLEIFLFWHLYHWRTLKPPVAFLLWSFKEI